MANVRAGVAYVDVRLGTIDKMKADLTKEIDKLGEEVGKKLGDKVKDSVPKDTGEKVGSQLGKTLTQSFARETKENFGAGLRAAATGQFQVAGRLFADAGKSLGRGLVNGLNKAMDGFGSGIVNLSQKAISLGTTIGNSIEKGAKKIGEFGTKLDKASQKMGFLSFQIQNFGIIASAVFTAPIAAATLFATVIGVKTAAQIESATNALKYLLPKGVAVADVLDRLKKIAIDSPIFDTTDLIQYAQKFTAAGVSIDKTERFLKAFSNIALVTGANTDEANRSVVAITQAFGKGKLQAEELNQQLGEAMPSVLKLLRDQLGVTQAELTNMVKEGKISGDDLIAIFTKIGESPKFLKGAVDGAQTLNGKFQQLKETLQTKLGDFFLKNSKQIKDALDKLGPALSGLIDAAGPVFLDLIKLFGTLVTKFSELITWYKNLTPGTKDLILKFIGLAAALGPVVLVAGTFLGAIAGISAGLAAILTPVGAVVAGIVLLGAGIAAGVVWLKKFLSGNSETAQKIKDAWNGFYASTIVPIIDAFKQLWETIKTTFADIGHTLGTDTGAFKSWGGFLKEVFRVVLAYVVAFAKLIGESIVTLINVIKPLIVAIGYLIRGAINLFKGLTDFIIGIFTGDWARAWKGVQEIFIGAFQIIVGVATNVLKAIVNLVKGFVTSIINFFKNLYDELVGHSIIPDMVKAILKWFQTLINGIKTVINGIKTVFSGMAAIAKTFANYFATGVTTAVNFMKSLPGKIVGALSGLASTLFNLGYNVMKGFLNGLSSIAGSVIDKARSIANSVKDTVAGALKIGSPSKVFFGYGKNVVQGFVNGLSAEQRSLDHSLSVFSDQPRFEQINGSPAQPLGTAGSNTGLSIENYYANDQVDPWRQAEDWYFIVTSRGGIS